MQEVFLEVVVKEISATNTYEFVNKGCERVVAEHLCTYHVAAVHYDQLSSLFVRLNSCFNEDHRDQL